MTHSKNRRLHIDYNNRYAFECAQADLKKREEELIRLKRQQEDSINAVLKISPSERQELNALIKNLALLWRAESTAMVMKKNLLRCLINDVTITRVGLQAEVKIRWRTQACTTLEVTLPRLGEQSRYSPQIVELIKTLAPDHTDREIAERLNRAGFRSMVGANFDRETIFCIRKRYQIARPRQAPTEETMSSSNTNLVARLSRNGRLGQPDPQLVEVVKTMASTHSDRAIADRLNQAGFRNLRGLEFCRKTVCSLRQRYQIPSRRRVVAETSIPYPSDNSVLNPTVAEVTTQC